MHQSIYEYNDSEALTRSLLAWLNAPDTLSHTWESLDLAANGTLEAEASDALIRSSVAQTLQSLKFTEIYFTPAQLAALLDLPALTELYINGGTSSDWNGPTYVYSTLEMEHIDVLATHTNSSRLKTIQLANQNLSEVTGYGLRRSLPHLQTLSVEYISY